MPESTRNRIPDAAASAVVPRPAPAVAGGRGSTPLRPTVARLVEPTYPNVAAAVAAEASSSARHPAAGSVVIHGRQFAEQADV